MIAFLKTDWTNGVRYWSNILIEMLCPTHQIIPMSNSRDNAVLFNIELWVPAANYHHESTTGLDLAKLTKEIQIDFDQATNCVIKHEIRSSYQSKQLLLEQINATYADSPETLMKTCYT